MTDKLTPGHQEDAKKIVEFVGSVKPIEVMTDKDRKLAEEILRGCEHDGSYIPVLEVKRLMQKFAEAYHEAKLKEITDEDIQLWAKGDCNSIESYVYRLVIDAKIYGAKAMRNGEIKHKER